MVIVVDILYGFIDPECDSNTSLKLSAEDFAPAPPASDAERIARPSLSYWEDAWQRLKQNTRALISLYIVIALAAFTLIGPLLWTIDPSQQDLNQISQHPACPKAPFW